MDVFLVTGTAFNIPHIDFGVYNYVVDWGDGTQDTITAWDQAETFHDYGPGTSGRTFRVTCVGQMPSIRYNNDNPQRFDVYRVVNLGVMGWQRIQLGFTGCNNMVSFRSGITDTSQCTTFNGFLANTTGLQTCDVRTMNTSGANDLGNMFANCAAPDIDPSGFDLSGIDRLDGLDDFMADSGMTTENYDNTLIAWAASDQFNGLTPNFGSSTYTLGGDAEAARNKLQAADPDGDAWVITDAGGI
jgi:hypothetical protein